MANEKLLLNFKDILYEFLQVPTRENFSKLVLKNNGEQNNIDFKEEWLKDSSKLAQIVLGIANSGGGAIIFGLKENGDGTNTAIGLSSIKDKAKIYNELKGYLPEILDFMIFDFDYSGEDYAKLKNRIFQVVLIHSDDRNLPYICNKSGEKVKEGDIFIRRGTQTQTANTYEMQKLISKRIGTMHSNTYELELKDHLSQLEVLFECQRTKRRNVYYEFMVSTIENTLGYEDEFDEFSKDNEEDYGQFISRMITTKKSKIEQVLGLK